jgi:hypothetical protein
VRAKIEFAYQVVGGAAHARLFSSRRCGQANDGPSEVMRWMSQLLKLTHC